MLRLRQVALVAADLEAAERDLSEALGIERCFRDPGVAAFGLHNALFPVGDRFVEIVSPTESGTTAGRLLDKRGGDGGYMVLLQTDDLGPFRRRFDDLAVRVVYEAVTDGIVGLHLHPADVGSAIVSIDRSDTASEWPWAGPVWREHRRNDSVTDLVAVELQADDPDQTAQRWAAVLGREVVRTGSGEITIELDDATIGFVAVTDGRGPGLRGFDVVATDRSRAGSTLEVVGVTIGFV